MTAIVKSAGLQMLWRGVLFFGLLAAIMIIGAVFAPAKAEITQFCGERYCADAQYAGHERHKKGKSKRYTAPPSRAEKPTFDANGNGVVRSHKTGATARVSPQHSAKFQAYIDDLESGGAVIRFIGGYRRGHCWSGGLHPCGKALDVCQLSRGRVDARCNLPGRARLALIAAKHGLFEGGLWCHHDYGHAQVGVTAGACGSNLYAAVSKYKRHARLAKRSVTQ